MTEANPPIAPEHKALEVVGQRVLRKDGLPKVLGAAQFCADMRLPDLLYAALVLPPAVPARLKSLDVSEALAMGGVAAILTARDLTAARTFGMVVADMPVIADEVVRQVGDPVALVAAETQALADAAARAVRAEFEPVPGVYSPEEARAPGAPPVHADYPDRVGGNVYAHYKIRKGDMARGWAEADVVLKGTYRTQHVDHAYLEPEGGLAVPNPDGSITLYGPMQAPFLARKALGPVLNLPLNRIRVITTVTGGGFGGKEETSVETLGRAGLLALRTRRPVLLQHSRHLSLLIHGKRCPMTFTHRLGATRDGKLRALEVEVLLDKGAYASAGGRPLPNSGGIIKKMIVHITGPYTIPHVQADAYSVFTNNPTTVPMRGLGVPQAHFAMECAMDELARRLAMDPWELRMRNALELGSTTGTGQVLTHSVGLKECLYRVKDLAGWGAPRPAARASRGSDVVTGRGLAAFFYSTGSATYVDAASASVYLTEDGTVQVAVAIVDYGQGANTVFAQLAAEELGVPYDDVEILQPDTYGMPDAGITAGSRSTTIPGNAVVDAARQVKRMLLEVAGEALRVQPTRLVIQRGRIFEPPNEARCLTLKETIPRAMRLGRPLAAQGYFASPPSTFDPETGQGNPFPVYSYGVQVADVEVDTRTGEVTLRRVYAVHDVGKAVNPSGVEAQIEGGVVMGAGMALSEEVRLRNGVPWNANFTDYILPTTVDSPEIVTDIVESPNAMGPFGAKGVGESALVPTAAAIANAIRDAVGVRLTHLPMTAERILAALHARGSEAAGGIARGA
jgi:CO/xanthine dehydrogenase Mo-binding subunit